MPQFSGGCTCGRVRYKLNLESIDDARTSLCHCGSCKRAMGGAFGLTAKVPLTMFELTDGSPKLFIQANGVRREFCDNCGSFVVEYGEANIEKFRYACHRSRDLRPECCIIRTDNEWICDDRHAGRWSGCPATEGRVLHESTQQVHATDTWLVYPAPIF